MQVQSRSLRYLLSIPSGEQEAMDQQSSFLSCKEIILAYSTQFPESITSHNGYQLHNASCIASSHSFSHLLHSLTLAPWDRKQAIPAPSLVHVSTQLLETQNQTYMRPFSGAQLEEWFLRQRVTRGCLKPKTLEVSHTFHVPLSLSIINGIWGGQFNTTYLSLALTIYS